MHLHAIGSFGRHVIPSQTRPQPHTPQLNLQFGSQLDEIRLRKNPPQKPEEAFKALCDTPLPCKAGDSVPVVLFLEELIEKGGKTLDKLTEGLNLTEEAIKTLEASFGELTKEKFVKEFTEAKGHYAVTVEGLQALKTVYPDLKLPQFGYLYDPSGYVSRCSTI